MSENGLMVVGGVYFIITIMAILSFYGVSI
jgi:preprotein translocase subunit Sss1